MQIHPPDALHTLPHSACIGPIDPTTVPRTVIEPTTEEKRIAKARAALPHPRSALNLMEIEVRTTPQSRKLFRGLTSICRNWQKECLAQGPGLTIVQVEMMRLVESRAHFCSQPCVNSLTAFSENRKSFSRFWFRPLV